MDEQLKIVYRNYGIADRFPDCIELNKHLKKWPSLHKALIEHEARHTNRKGFTKEDLVHDLSTPNQLSTWKMMKFIMRHPFSLVQFVPVYWTRAGQREFSQMIFRSGIKFDIKLNIVPLKNVKNNKKR